MKRERVGRVGVTEERLTRVPAWRGGRGEGRRKERDEWRVGMG